MREILDWAKEIAVGAAQEAASLARSRFGAGAPIMEKGAEGDLVTEVDYAAEAVILHRLREAFPEHQIRSEEQGWSGVEGDWLWLVDPLDGTNNYAIGLPVYGVSLTLLYRKEPILGVIVDSAQGMTYVAEKGGGATMNGRLLRTGVGRELRKATVGWIQGHLVQKDGAALRLKTGLDSACKRVLRLWAPSLLWCMLARGDLDGIVLYNSEGDDLYAGILMAMEAGAAVVDFAGKPFAGMNDEPYLIACHPERVMEMTALVNQILSGGEGDDAV